MMSFGTWLQIIPLLVYDESREGLVSYINANAKANPGSNRCSLSIGSYGEAAGTTPNQLGIYYVHVQYYTLELNRIHRETCKCLGSIQLCPNVHLPSCVVVDCTVVVVGGGVVVVVVGGSVGVVVVVSGIVVVTAGVVVVAVDDGGVVVHAPVKQNIFQRNCMALQIVVKHLRTNNLQLYLIIHV